MPPVTTLFPAAAADVPLLAAMMPDLYHGDEHTPDATQWAAGVRGLISAPEHGRVWLIRMQDELAGYVVLTFGYSLEYFGPYAFLDELYLLPAFRGRGIGTEVIAWLVAYARRTGLRSLHLEVDEANADGQRFYLARGFHYRGHMHLMSLALDAAA